MLTPEQEKWIAHLSDQDLITIIPYDPSAPRTFDEVRRKIKQVLGPEVRVEHRGATSLGISGQDEIDVYIPVPEDQFEALLAPLSAAFDNPRSYYPRERARFVTVEAGKHVDIFLINEDGSGWRRGIAFEQYLKSHPEALEQYRLLKEAGSGLSTREYYRRKITFINQILVRAGAMVEGEP